MSLSWADTPLDDFAVVVDIVSTNAGSALDIVIVGELDLATGPQLIAAVADVESDTAAKAAAEVRFHLDQLGFIDAAGFSALTTVAAGRPATVLGATSAARRLFQIVDASNTFDIA